MDRLPFWLLIVIVGVCAAETNCGPAEYKNKEGECCPICGKGYVVYRGCIEKSSTTCIPCVGETYMSEPNGLNKCFKCKTCDLNQCLYTSLKCTTLSDTVCDVLSGYYCESYAEDNDCPFEVNHSECSPGQGVKTPGTERTDTMCEDCKEGYFSINGINCTEHTNCAVLGEELEEKGSPTKDNMCRKPARRRDGLIAALIFFSLAFQLFLRKYHSCIWLNTRDTEIRDSTGSTTDQVLPIFRTIPVQETGECPDQSLQVENEDRSTEILSPQRTMPSLVSQDDELDDGLSKLTQSVKAMEPLLHVVWVRQGVKNSTNTILSLV